jgi:hypothetical protein
MSRTLRANLAHPERLIVKNFLLGLGLGVGLGYYFHEDITKALLDTAVKADEEKPAEPTS